MDPRVAQTRRDVLDAALELVAERGFEGATIERVAERSGVARSTIYRRWPEPWRMFVEAFEPRNAIAFEPPTGRFDTDLRRYLAEYAARLNDRVYFTAFLALADRAARLPAWGAAHRAVVNENTSRAASILRAGIKAGTVRLDTDVERAVADVLSPFLYARLVRFEQISAAEQDRVRRQLLARFGCPPPARRATTAATKSTKSTAPTSPTTATLPSRPART
jgi:AcrR family transcriptional regulator